MLEEDQVMVEQLADEQVNRTKDAEIDDNNNNSEEEDEVEKEVVGIEFTQHKADLEMMKMLLTLDGRMYKEYINKTLLRLTWLRIYKSKLMRKFFSKSNWKVVWLLVHRT